MFKRIAGPTLRLPITSHRPYATIMPGILVNGDHPDGRQNGETNGETNGVQPPSNQVQNVLGR